MNTGSSQFNSSLFSFLSPPFWGGSQPLSQTCALGLGASEPDPWPGAASLGAGEECERDPGHRESPPHEGDNTSESDGADGMGWVYFCGCGRNVCYLVLLLCVFSVLMCVLFGSLLFWSCLFGLVFGLGLPRKATSAAQAGAFPVECDQGLPKEGLSVLISSLHKV